MNPVTLEVMQGAQLALVLTPLALQLAMKIKAILEQAGAQSNVTATIKELTGEAITIDQDAIDTVNAWLKEQGITA